MQYFIVITAVPVGFIMLPTLWAAPMYVRRLAREQGLSARQGKPDKSAQTPVGS